MVLDSKNNKDIHYFLCGCVFSSLAGAEINVYITVLVDNVEALWGRNLGVRGRLDGSRGLAGPGLDPAQDVDPDERGHGHEGDAEPGGDQEEVSGLKIIVSH